MSSLFARLRRSLQTPVPPDDYVDCLADFTAEEIIAAADALDNGEQAEADALVNRVPADHARCMAFAILQHVSGIGS